VAQPSLLLVPLLGGIPFALAGDGNGAGDGAALFAEPVLLTAGDKPLGRGVLYPSPLLFDVDGDGQREMLLGDLAGRLHVARKLPGDDPLAWSETELFKGADGEILKFSNW
jgi:hypothetical protein